MGNRCEAMRRTLLLQGFPILIVTLQEAVQPIGSQPAAVLPREVTVRPHMLESSQIPRAYRAK